MVGKRVAALVLAGLLLCGGTALAGSEDALGYYFELEQDKLDALDAAAEDIVALLIEPDMTDGEKALVLHDWVVLNCSYGVNYYQDMAYGALVRGQVICRGYARGFQYLAEKAGLGSEYTFSVDLLHAWTLTALEGSYYCIDPTWDDDHYERIGFVNHRHCMFSTARERELSHYGEDTSLIAEGGIYENAPWHEAVTRVVFEGEYFYYISRELWVVRCRRDNWQCETLYQIEESWPDFYEDYDGSAAPATGLVLVEGRLWFNSPTELLSIKTDGSGLRVEATADRSEGWLCGTDVRDGKLVCSVSDHKENAGWQLYDTGISGWGAWGYFPAEEGPWTGLIAAAERNIPGGE